MIINKQYIQQWDTPKNKKALIHFSWTIQSKGEKVQWSAACKESSVR